MPPLPPFRRLPSSTRFCESQPRFCIWLASAQFSEEVRSVLSVPAGFHKTMSGTAYSSREFVPQTSVVLWSLTPPSLPRTVACFYWIVLGRDPRVQILRLVASSSGIITGRLLVQELGVHIDQVVLSPAHVSSLLPNNVVKHEPYDWPGIPIHRISPSCQS